MTFAYFRKGIKIPQDGRRLVILKEGYGKNWPKQRKLALIRDNYSCCACGHVGKKKGRYWDVSVHHKIKISHFVKDGIVDYEKANDLSNLITLCEINGCHRYWDGHENKSGFTQLK